ncbi:hypothetical protein [Chroococcidiopsis sp.]|uniref:hypothetical protein n=1 Tax=Chroococcidiopsis sp. TaxID=3088168 RepID=UPI003F2B36F3
MHPFVTINSTVQSSDTTTTQKLSTIYIVGTKGTGTIGPNEIKPIPTVNDFNTIVGSGSLSAPSYNFIRTIEASTAVTIYFVNGFSTNASPTLKDHLLAGVLLLAKNIRLPAGVILCPELGTLTVAADIVTVFQAFQNLVSNSLLNWEYYHNLSLLANDKTKASAERASLSSPQGHSSCYFGYGRDSNNNQIPASAVAAARLMYLNRTKRGYFSPAAYQEPIPFKSVDPGFIPKWEIGIDEYTELVNSGINCIYLNGDGITNSSYLLCGARTLSTDLAWYYQNTRYTANNIFFRASSVLEKFLFLPSDISTIANRNAVPVVGLQEQIVNADVILATRVLMDTLAFEGAFSTPPIKGDNTQDEPYTVLPLRTPDGNLALTIEMYLVQTREKISLNFVKKS